MTKFASMVSLPHNPGTYVQQHAYQQSTFTFGAPSYATMGQRVRQPPNVTPHQNSVVRPNGPLRTWSRAPKYSAPPPGKTIGPRIELSRDTTHSGLKAKHFQLGLIISTPHFEPNLNKSIKAGHAQRTESRLGPVCAKFRHFIVLAKFYNHLLAYPMISHSDRGIGDKPEDLRKECIGTKRSDDDKYQNDAPYLPLTVQEVGFDLRGTSNILVTAPVVINYDAQIQFDGCITTRSYVSLTRLYEFLMKGKLIEGLKEPPIEIPGLQQLSSHYGGSIATSGCQSFSVPSASQQIPSYPQNQSNGRPVPTPTKSGSHTPNENPNRFMPSGPLPVQSQVSLANLALVDSVPQASPATPRASLAPSKRPGSSMSYASTASKACKVSNI